MPNVFLLRPLALLAIAACFLAPAPAEEIDYDQEAAIRAQLQAYLPRTLPKLERRARIRVLVLGDEISRFGFGPGEDPRQCWHALLLEKLASKFYYGGGVRILGHKPLPPPPPLAPDERLPLPDLPPRGEIPPLAAVIAGSPEIVLRNQALNMGTSIRGLQTLTTDGFDDHPDLVIWMYGLHDALSQVPVSAYRLALEAVVRECQTHQADLIIAGPSLVCGDDLRSLTRTLDYAHVARTVARHEKLCYCDMAAALGNLTANLPPDPKIIFPAYLELLQRSYRNGAALDIIHPNAAGHQLMADTAWEILLGTAPAPELATRGSFTLADESGSPNLEISFLQQGTAEHPAPEISGAMLTVLQAPGGWQRVGEHTIPVKAFTESRTVRMPTEAALSKDGPTLLPLGETATCGFILYTPGRARLVSIDAVVVPITLDIPVQRLEGAAGDILLDAIIANKTTAEFRATAEIEWLGKKTELTVALEGNSSKPLKLRLNLPEGNSVHATLVVRLKTPERSYDFQRTIDATRNFLPDQKLSFSGQEARIPNLTVKVEPHGLWCAFELPPAKAPGGFVSLMIDARDPIERGRLGFIGDLQIQIPAQDGPIPITKMPAAIFGSGYDRSINATYFQASLKTAISGTRIVEIGIPKALFYLHQWSLSERGQNRLGFNAQVMLPEFPAPVGLTNSKFSNNDTSSLGVLQLTSKSSGEWSVRVY